MSEPTWWSSRILPGGPGSDASRSMPSAGVWGRYAIARPSAADYGGDIEDLRGHIELLHQVGDPLEQAGIRPQRVSGDRRELGHRARHARVGGQAALDRAEIRIGDCLGPA